MRVVTINVGGKYPHKLVLHVKEDVELRRSKVDKQTAVQQFMEWWGGQCSRRGLPSPHDPACYRILRNLLAKYGEPVLKVMALHLFENHADRLRKGEPQHFVYFATKQQVIKRELEELGLWPREVEGDGR